MQGKVLILTPSRRQICGSGYGTSRSTGIVLQIILGIMLKDAIVSIVARNRLLEVNKIMSLKNASRLFGALASAFLLCGAASAAPVGTGTFNVTSSFYVTAGAFYIGADAGTAGPSANQQVIITSPNTGAFSDLTIGTTAQMQSLTFPPVVPGGSFTLSQWVVLPDGIDLDLTSLPLSQYALCTGADSAACQAVANSPITLHTAGNAVSADFTVGGWAYYAASPNEKTPFTGIFTAQFPDTTISSLLNQFATQGFVTTSFSASNITTAVPEPASLALIGAGLFALGLFGKKKFAK